MCGGGRVAVCFESVSGLLKTALCVWGGGGGGRGAVCFESVSGLLKTALCVWEVGGGLRGVGGGLCLF